MDREQFIKVLEGCIESATGRRYPHIDWTKLTDRGLINCAEMVRDLLERRRERASPLAGALSEDGRMH